MLSSHPALCRLHGLELLLAHGMGGFMPAALLCGLSQAASGFFGTSAYTDIMLHKLPS